MSMAEYTTADNHFTTSVQAVIVLLLRSARNDYSSIRLLRSFDFLFLLLLKTLNGFECTENREVNVNDGLSLWDPMISRRSVVPSVGRFR